MEHKAHHQKIKHLVHLFLFFVSVCNYAQTTPGEYTIKNLDANTKYSNFGTAFYGENKIVFASPIKGAEHGRKVWDYRNRPYLDLYIGEITNQGEIVNINKLPGNINSKYHEGVVSFTKDGKTVYFSANSSGKKKEYLSAAGINNVQLFKASVNKKGEWTHIERLPFNGTEFSTGHPALNKNDTELYFVSDRPGSMGKTDIFVVNIKSDGTYGNPRNLGPKINTAEKEMFPFISDDNILYFSSKGHQGHGNLDVYASKIFDNTVSDPINLESPVNSEEDDFAYIIDDKNHRGYFSSNREGGKGDDDIYFFSASPPLHIDCHQTISGTVRDKETKELLPGALVVLIDLLGNELERTMADEQSASFSIEAPCDGSYKILVSQKNYLNEEMDVKTVNDIDAEAIVTIVELMAEPWAFKDDIEVNTVYFDFDKFNLRHEAKQELDKIIGVMKKHPELLIKVQSHTDSRGTDSYNIKLSKNRAKATVEYLINKGISSERITGEGYGESQLYAYCPNGVRCSEYQNQINRRSEFLIVNNVTKDTLIKSINLPKHIDPGHVPEIFSKMLTQNTLGLDQGNGMIYTVQVGAFKGNPQSEIFNKKSDLFHYYYNDGFNRYFSGRFKTRTEANKHKLKLIKEGFKGAFVVGLKAEK